jgi:hypothetical protein
MIREMKLTSIEGRYYLFPVPVIKERKYLISCSSKDEAVLISEAILTQKIKHPDLISEDFIFLTYHSDKRTKIFYLNPRIKL